TILTRFFFQAEDGIRDPLVTGVQTCALPIFGTAAPRPGKTHCPVRTSYIQPCHGHASRAPDSFPALSGPPLWAQTSPSACTRSRSEERRVGKECQYGGGGDQ